MAIVIVGQTPCLLCGTLLAQGQRTVQFPPFVANEADPIWKFSDAAMHEECFRGDPLAAAAESRYRELRERGDPAKSRCHVCGNRITNPGGFFPFGYLTGDVSHRLYRLNYAVFHRSCLPRWSELASMRELATAQLKSGLWKGRGMRGLVEALADAQSQQSGEREVL
jgi:hypothetical protein